MSAELRDYFFGPLIDKFKNGDIPTEQTFRNLLDSVPFFRQLDTAFKTKGGLVKSVSDEQVNDRNGADALGLSPLGYKTFVQPQQLFRLLPGTNVTITPVVRALPLGGDDESGVGIEDYRIDVSVVIPPPTIPDADDVQTTDDISVKALVGSYPFTGVNTITLIDPSAVQTALEMIAQYQRELTDDVKALSDALRDEQLSAVGRCEPTIEPPGFWTAKYLEPNGQSLAIATYPDLFAKIGYTHGGGGATFNLPNHTTDAYLRVLKTSSAVLGTMTGQDSYALTMANIPEHDHAFSGNTNVDGPHTHELRVYDQDPGYLVADGNGGGGLYNTTNTENGGTHSHAFSGTTDMAGANPVTPVPLTPRAFNVYIKMRVLP